MSRRSLLLLPLAGLLAGCTSGGWELSQGGIQDNALAFASDQATSFSCRKFDPETGALTDEVVIQRNLNPNAQMVAEMGALARAGLDKIPSPIPGVPMGARGSSASPQADRPLDVPTCLGEHAPNVRMRPPAMPAPSMGQPAAAFPEMLEAPEPEPASVVYRDGTGARREASPLTWRLMTLQGNS